MSTWDIPQADPGAGYKAHKAEIDAAIQQVLSGGRYIAGEELTAFEQDFARYLGLSDVIGVGNGTDALAIALKACGIGPGDTVLTVSHTAVATVAAIEMAGAAPLLVDVEPDTFTIDPQHIESTIKAYKEQRIKAIIPVHLYGQPADLPAILDIARRYDLFVIEDCAQSHGAVLDGKHTGSWGHISAFSFYPTKNLGALGDGGAIGTSDPKLAERARRLHEYGWRERFISEIPGVNSRLDELQAAVLRVKMKYLDQDNQCRRELAQIYDARLGNLQDLKIPPHRRGAHVYHQYVVRAKSRQELRGYLGAQSIQTALHYPLPVHLQPAYLNRLSLGPGGLPVTELLTREIMSLPIFPQLSDELASSVCEKINEFFSVTG